MCFNVYFQAFDNTFASFKDLISDPFQFLIFYLHFKNHCHYMFAFFCFAQINIWMWNHFVSFLNSNHSLKINHYYIDLYYCLKECSVDFKNWSYSVDNLNVFGYFDFIWKLNYWYFIDLMNHNWPNSNFAHRMNFINFKYGFDFIS
jgi:hypothetical protein